jgi:SAM domain (Sterile alpha motif)
MEVASWSIEQVGIWLSALELSNLVPAFKANAVDGRDLLQITDEEMSEQLGMTPIQISKVKRELQKAQARASAALTPPAAINETVAPGVVLCEQRLPAQAIAKQNSRAEFQHSQMEEGNATVIQVKPADEAARARKKKIIIGVAIGLVKGFILLIIYT